MPSSSETITRSGSGAPSGRQLMAEAMRWGDLLFLSGRAPVDPGTLQLRSDTFDDQARFVLDEIEAVLEEGGSGLEHVLRVECYLADAEDFPAWNRAFAQRFPSSPPARTTLVTGFAVPGMRIEVQVTAGVPS